MHTETEKNRKTDRENERIIYSNYFRTVIYIDDFIYKRSLPLRDT